MGTTPFKSSEAPEMDGRPQGAILFREREEDGRPQGALPHAAPLPSLL
jgi:hypothetical protein